MAEIATINLNDGTDNEFTGLSAGCSVSAAAALAATAYGLLVNITDNNPNYGYKQLASPNTSGQFRARIYLDYNTLSMANNNDYYFWRFINSSSQAVANVRLYITSGVYKIRPTHNNDAGSEVAMTGVTISDEPHYIEVHLVRASSAVASDGTFTCWLDGTQVGQQTGIDNYDRFPNLNIIQIGACSGVESGTRGTWYIDELVVNDDGSEIGPVGGGGSTYEESISLGRSLGTQLANNAVFENSLGLGRSLGAGVANVAVLENSLSLGRSLDAQLAGNLIIEESMSLGRGLSAGVGNNADFQNSIVLGRILQATAAHVAVLGDALSLGRSLGVAITGGLDLSDTISLGRSLALALADLLTKEEAISLGLSRAIQIATELQAENSIALGKALGIQAGSQAVFEATITLARGQAVTLTGAMTLEEAITLGAALSLAVSEETSGFASLTFGIVRGPSGDGGVQSGGPGTIGGPSGSGTLQ